MSIAVIFSNIPLTAVYYSHYILVEWVSGNYPSTIVKSQ